jgi:hypothetical protein
MAMANSTVLAHAVATVVGVGYMFCRLIAAVAPGFLFNVGQSWFHTVNLEPLPATGSLSAQMFFLGLLTGVVVSWVAAFPTSELYRRWVE